MKKFAAFFCALSISLTAFASNTETKVKEVVSNITGVSSYQVEPGQTLLQLGADMYVAEAILIGLEAEFDISFNDDERYAVLANYRRTTVQDLINTVEMKTVSRYR